MDRFATLTVVQFREGDRWISQGLEIDLCTSAPTLAKLREKCRGQIACQLGLDREDGIEPFSRLKPAPAEFWKMARDGARTAIFPLDPAGLPTPEELQAESVPVTSIEDAVE